MSFSQYGAGASQGFQPLRRPRPYAKRKRQKSSKVVGRPARYSGVFGGGPSIANIPRQLITDKFKVVDLPYFDVLTLTSIGFAYEFRLNDCYDPDLTGTGHQPRGFDQWMTLYRQFRVTQAKITVHFADSGTVFGIPSVCWIHVGNSSFGATPTGTTMLETPGTVSKLANLSNPCTLSQRVKNWEVLGSGYKSYMADDRTAGTASASPVDQVVCNIGVISADHTTAIPDYDVNVTIVYRVVFFENMSPAAS